MRAFIALVVATAALAPAAALLRKAGAADVLNAKDSAVSKAADSLGAGCNSNSDCSGDEVCGTGGKCGSCNGDGGSCQNDSQCCSKSCSSKKECHGCNGLGGNCNSDGDCCDGYSCGTGGQCSTCNANGGACNSNADCCHSNCDTYSQVCGESTSTTSCLDASICS